MKNQLKRAAAGALSLLLLSLPLPGLAEETPEAPEAPIQTEAPVQAETPVQTEIILGNEKRVVEKGRYIFGE